ncbi:rhs element Vgr protein, partial [Escherichia coli PA38]
GPL